MWGSWFTNMGVAIQQYGVLELAIWRSKVGGRWSEVEGCAVSDVGYTSYLRLIPHVGITPPPPLYIFN